MPARRCVGPLSVVGKPRHVPPPSRPSLRGRFRGYGLHVHSDPGGQMLSLEVATTCAPSRVFRSIPVWPLVCFEVLFGLAHLNSLTQNLIQR